MMQQLEQHAARQPWSWYACTGHDYNLVSMLRTDCSGQMGPAPAGQGKAMSMPFANHFGPSKHLAQHALGHPCCHHSPGQMRSR